MNYSATGRRWTLFASAHSPAAGFEADGRLADFDDGESDVGAEGSGSAVVKRECCFGVRFVIVGSKISG